MLPRAVSREEQQVIADEPAQSQAPSATDQQSGEACAIEEIEVEDLTVDGICGVY